MDETEESVNLKNIARDIRQVLLLVREVVKYMKEAESEIPEKMRRFIMYFHDVHDLIHLYHENGLDVPHHLKYEIERCSDRYRHILEELHSGTGAFDKVRQEMSKQAGNRYDHSKLLPRMEKANETGPSNNVGAGEPEGGTDAEGGGA